PSLPLRRPWCRTRGLPEHRVRLRASFVPPPLPRPRRGTAGPRCREPAVGRVIEPGHSSVTVVVPAYNEQEWIRDCLDSLLAQDYPDFVVLVVDGFSTDDTRPIVEEVTARDGRVRLLDNPRRTAAAAMNVGLASTTTDVLLRADAHAVYAPDFVAKSVQVLAETGADDVGGPMRPVGT